MFSPHVFQDERSKPTLTKKKKPTEEEEDEKAEKEDLVELLKKIKSGSDAIKSLVELFKPPHSHSQSVRVLNNNMIKFIPVQVSHLSFLLSFLQFTHLSIKWQVLVVIVFCALLQASGEEESKPYQFGFNLGTQHREERKGTTQCTTFNL